MSVNTALLLTGIGLRPSHYEEIIEKKPPLAWLEVHSENYFGEGGKDLYFLEKIRAHYPISLHGVNLSLGSSDELNWQYLKNLNDLIKKIDPCLVSDHLAWTSIEGQYFHDLLPLPLTEETLSHFAKRIRQVQDYLKRQILIENITQYINFKDSTIPENEFLESLALETGCAILLDINNIYVNAINFNKEPTSYFEKISAKNIIEFHLAGFSSITKDNREILIDSHDRSIVPAVWDLYKAAINTFGPKPTIIEWDKNLPSLNKLYLEAYQADKIMREKLC